MLRPTRWAALLVLVLVAVPATATIRSTASASVSGASSLTWCRDPSSMAIIGDSGATGYGVTDPRNGWVARLRRARPHIRITNYAHNGAMVSDFLPGGRWPETTGAVDRLAAEQPSLVLIELGGNEYYIDRDPARYRADLDTLTRAIRSASPRSTLVYETIWPFDPRASPAAVHPWADYAAAMRSVAARYRARWIDLRPFFPPAHAAPGDVRLLGADRIHPTDAGNAVEFSAVAGALDSC